METVEWQKTREGLGTPQVIRILGLRASELVAMHTSSNVDKVKLNKLKVQNYSAKPLTARTKCYFIAILFEMFSCELAILPVFPL